MKTGRDGVDRRFEKRNLAEMLVHKFLAEYGYDHGPVIARAIVADILETVERCSPESIPPQTVVWLAVRREANGRRKGLEATDLTPVRLRVVTQEEVRLLVAPALRREFKAYRAFNRTRYARWCFEAFEQGGVLTLLDLSLMSGLSEHYVGELLWEYEAETGQVVPTRGTVHDMGPAVTHKAEVVRRWLRGDLPSQIARDLRHSQDAVDRYLADFQKVRLLAQKFPLTALHSLCGLSASLVRQYVALIHEYEPNLALYSAASGDNEAVPAASEREPGAQPASRAKSAASLDAGEHRAILEQPLELRPAEDLTVGH